MILIFGSINVDLIVPVPNLPQPGETVLGGDYALVPGGKGANQALAARRAGSEVVLAGAVGPDSFAGIALELLQRGGVDTHLVRVVHRPTGCAAIVVSQAGENAIAVAPGANTSVRSDQVPDESFDANTILLAQMEVPVRETETLMGRVRARGGRCLLNLAPALPIDLRLLSAIDLLVANEGEVTKTGLDPPQLARRLRQGLVVHAWRGRRDRISRRWQPDRGARAADRGGRHDGRRRYVCRCPCSSARSGVESEIRSAAGERSCRPRLPRVRRSDCDAG